MHVEAVHQLAINLRSSPHLFACLLGSGVSRSAGVPTGWEVLLDLVRKYAVLLNEGEQAASDPAVWFAKRTGREPDYSDVIQALAPTSALQRNVLDEYFTVVDRASGQRTEHEPTPAHRAIARLVKRGLMRVVITTNFDRLMENALREAGVSRFEVVSSAEQAANCYPFHACDAFVLKVHGDWRDIGLRNSRDALAAYPDATAVLLRRILDEHGLLICGWSAESDVALRQALQQYHRRFPVYWVDPKLGEAASALSATLRATHLPSTADAFFGELELAVSALEQYGPPARLSGEVLVLRAQRAIEAGRQIELETVLSDATRALLAWIRARTEEPPQSESAEGAQLEAAERAAEPLCRLTAALAHYGAQPRMISDVLGRLLYAAQEREFVAKDRMAAYPAVLVGLTWGAGCAARNNWQAAADGVFTAGAAVRFGFVFPPGSNTHLSRFGGRYKYSPQAIWGERVAGRLYEFSERWIPRRDEFEEAYDRFDVLVAVRSARLGEWWIPRCFVERDAGGRFSRFKEIFEEWLVPQVRDQGEAVRPAFAGIDESPVAIVAKLAQVAEEQQTRWKR
jgi:hypothetical protein